MLPCIHVLTAYYCSLLYLHEDIAVLHTTYYLYLLVRYLHEDVAVHIAVLDGIVGADAPGDEYGVGSK